MHYPSSVEAEDDAHAKKINWGVGTLLYIPEAFSARLVEVRNEALRAALTRIGVHSSLWRSSFLVGKIWFGFILFS